MRYSSPSGAAHALARKRSDLNQREHCEAQGLSLKAFGKWRAKFKVESQPLLETAKLNGVEPYAYLKDVLERMANDHPMSQIDDLLPWNWSPSVASE